MIFVGLLMACFLLASLPCQAGLFDSMKKAAGEAADQFKKDVNTVGQEMGLVDKEAKLPGGVTSRLKKAAKELDKAEKALSKGAGTPADRAKRAENYLKAAKRYRDEIDKRYKGKFSPKHPKVKALDERMAKLAKRISSTGTAVASAGDKPAQAGAAAKPSGKLPAGVTKRLRDAERELDNVQRVLDKGGMSADYRAKQANYYLDRVRNILDEIQKRYPGQAPENHPQVKAVLDRQAKLTAQVGGAEKQAQAVQAEEQKASQAKADAAVLSQKWADRLKPFVTSGSKEFATYPTDEEAKWKRWDAIYAEAKPIWDEYQKVDFGGKKSGELQSREQIMARYMKNYETYNSQRQGKLKAAAARKGEFVFSKSPIDPKNPRNLTTSFKTGDHIYGFIRAKKPWGEIYRNKNSVTIMINTKLDGKKIHGQFINLKKPELVARNWLMFEIAPAKVTAYSNPDIDYGKSKADLRQGPQELCLRLGQLKPGKHTMGFEVQYYGKIYAAGSFSIEGSDYKFYADLNKKANQAVAKATVLPRAKMTNKSLAGQMKKLLLNAGWPNVYRLNIVDKDWWIDRVSGGNSAVKSRHMAAAAMGKGPDGYYYKVCTFHQPRLITGGWGQLELTHQGGKVPVPDENKDK